MNTHELIQVTRRLTDSGASVGSGPGSDADYLAYLNDAMRWIHARQIAMAPMAYARVSQLGSLVVTTEQISQHIVRVVLPDYVVRVIYLETDSHDKVQAVHNPRDYRGNITKSLDTVSVAVNWMVGADNDLIIRGSSAVDYRTWRIWYVRRPPDLARFVATEGTISTLVAEAHSPGATDGAVAETEPLGMLAWRADYYVGAKLEVVSANSAIPQGDIRRVSGFSLGTFPDVTFTVESPFSAVVDAGDTIDMIPQLDELYHELPCYMAASRMADRLGNPNAKQQLMVTARELYDEWKNIAAVRQAQDNAIIAPRS